VAEAKARRLVECLGGCPHRLGGVWEREIYINGNAVFTNKANGNRIFVPLR
jgi:hypothetical protein